MKDYELQATIDRLSDVRGGGTWNISLYIRPDKSIQSMRQRVVSEISEAQSIKSDDTRSKVISSLQKITDVLSNYQTTPENGIIVFSSPDSVTVLDDLPFECPENRYYCGKEFRVDPLATGFETGGTFGLIVVEIGAASIGVLNSGRIESTTRKESHVMGKTQAGGFSQQRFERERERQKHEFFLSVQETAYASFKPYDLDGVVIGGTISSAKEFADGYTNHDWDVIGTYSVDHADEQGLNELVERAQSALLEEERADERELVEQFFQGLRDGDAEYGRERVSEAIEQGRVETLLISSEIDCETIERLSADAQGFGSDVAVIDTTFENGRLFYEFGGIGAILRW